MVGDREQRLEGFLDLKAGCTDEFVFLKKNMYFPICILCLCRPNKPSVEWDEN